MNKRSRFYLSDKTRGFIVDVIVYLFVGLFIYTAASKVMDYKNFESTLKGSVLIGNYNTIVAWMVPTSEIIMSILLIVPITKRNGLICSLGLMTIFTTYLIYMIVSGVKLVCSCGGVVSSLSWQEHIWFNIGFIILAIIGLVLYKKE